HRVHPEISGDLLDRHPVLAVACNPNNVVAELLRIRPCHSDILPARPPWASDLRCHLFLQQTLLRQRGSDFMSTCSEMCCPARVAGNSHRDRWFIVRWLPRSARWRWSRGSRASGTGACGSPTLRIAV